AGHDYILLFVSAAFLTQMTPQLAQPCRGKKQPLDRICRSPDLSFMQELPLLVPRAPEIPLSA
ncbi:hypothetical protein BO78DRAFT_281856, partial [Aspergillus sclerotiicarbonarius CBS 121057]